MGGSKKREKGSEKLARKVFERNKATFTKKPSRVVFNDDDEDEDEEETGFFKDEGGTKSEENHVKDKSSNLVMKMRKKQDSSKMKVAQKVKKIMLKTNQVIW